MRCALQCALVLLPFGLRVGLYESSAWKSDNVLEQAPCCAEKDFFLKLKIHQNHIKNEIVSVSKDTERRFSVEWRSLGSLLG